MRSPAFLLTDVGRDDSPPKVTVFAGGQDAAWFFPFRRVMRGLKDGRRNPQISQVLHGPGVVPSAIDKRDHERSAGVIQGSQALDRFVDGDDVEVTAKEFDLFAEVFQEHRTGIQANVYGSASVIRQALGDREA